LPLITSKKTILALDPSKSATGWAIMRNNKLLDVGCFKFSPTKNQKSKIDEYVEFYVNYNEFLHRLCRENWVEEVCSEYPHGTQSYTAATALQIVKDSVCNLKVNLNIPVHFYTEAECKKTYYGKSKGIEKDLTVKEMTVAFADYGWVPCKTKYIDQAVADALLVLNHHLQNTVV